MIGMGTFIGILFTIFLIWLIWKYVLPEKAKETSIGCLAAIGVVLFIAFQVVGIFHMCSSDNDYYERDPYDDVRK